MEDDAFGRREVKEWPGKQEERGGKSEVAAHREGRELSKSKVWTGAEPGWQVNWAQQHHAYGPL